MAIVLVTGSSGLIGSETVKYFHQQGLDVIGIDNNLRKYYFGEEGSTVWNTEFLIKKFKNFRHYSIDIRNEDAIFALFEQLGNNLSLVIHTAAQPSHDWSAREPLTDFMVNAKGTLVLLEAVRRFCSEVPFIFTSTNKVYGDTPNLLPLIEEETRWEIHPEHHYHHFGIDECMTIDQSKHSIFGASKIAADVMTQEYGRYFGLNTAVFRGGCITGPAHSGAELHGFLAYLAKCVFTGTPYTIYGYKGKQVRDNIHAYDLVNAFWHYFQRPIAAAVYNMGGSRYSNCSVLEAISLIEKITGKKLALTISEQARSGDHIWWISDVRRFQNDYPAWSYKYDLEMIVEEIVDSVASRNVCR